MNHCVQRSYLRWIRRNIVQREFRYNRTYDFFVFVTFYRSFVVLTSLSIRRKIIGESIILQRPGVRAGKLFVCPKLSRKKWWTAEGEPATKLGRRKFLNNVRTRDPRMSSVYGRYGQYQLVSCPENDVLYTTNIYYVRRGRGRAITITVRCRSTAVITSRRATRLPGDVSMT